MFSFMVFSCKENPGSALLIQAQKLAENSPAEALALLDSIPNPEAMEKGEYMQYIITRTQAKYKDNQSVADDTLIFEAQRYFDTKGNTAQSALAHFYSGYVNYQNKKPDKALSSFMEAENYAREAHDNILTGRSHNNIGFQYYEQDIMDSAIFHYKLALDYYDKEKDTDAVLKMKAMYTLGSAFYVNYDLDSAFLYYSKGLELAKETGNQKYKDIFTNHEGVVLRVKGDYREAAGKLHDALTETVAAEDSVRIYLNLAKLFNSTQQADSAKYYTRLLLTRLPEIKDKYILSSIYGSLSKYNKLEGAYFEALQYADLSKNTNKEIASENQSLDLLKADKDFYLAKKDKQYSELLSSLYFYSSLGAVVLIVVLFFVVLAYRQNKKDKEIIRQEAEKYRKFKEYLISANKDYPQIEAEIKAMLEDENESD